MVLSLTRWKPMLTRVISISAQGSSSDSRSTTYAAPISTFFIATVVW
jgi:hypothetical protein